MAKPPGNTGKGDRIIRQGQTAVSQYGTSPKMRGTVTEKPHDLRP